jgi:hypothetical protein
VRPDHPDALNTAHVISTNNDRRLTMQTTNGSPALPARTHTQAAALFRRPFAPGAIGFRAMNKVPHNGDPFGGAQIAAYISAQSVIQRLNAVVPGRWRQEFRLLDPPPGAKRLYMACRLIVTLPISDDAPDAEAVYEDVGELDFGSRAGLKALYSDARKRTEWPLGSAPTCTPRSRPWCYPSEPRSARCS